MKALVVDDLETNRKLLKQLLISKGHSVLEAADGEQAIELFEKEQPDLILMDINMPGVDGYQATTRIKAMTADNYIPIIFVTAMSSETSLTSALAAGGDDFISKPVNIAVLESKINVHMRIRELNQQLNEKNRQLVAHNQKLVHEHGLVDYFFENALQQSFLDPSVIKYHISVMSLFNGDLLLAERGPGGGLYIVMGDFTGHGLTAAMGTLPVAQVFFNMTRTGAQIGDIAREINYQLETLMPVDMFFAATLLELDKTGQRLTVWAGGMPDAYWINKRGDFKGLVSSTHMPLGILADKEFDATTQLFIVNKGDKIYLHSDGVTEASNPGGEMFGDQRLKQVLTEHGDDRFERTLEALTLFCGETDQVDDITFIEISCDAIPAQQQDIGDNKLCDVPALPWRLSMTLSAADIRQQDPVKDLMNMLAMQPLFASHKSVIQTLLSELYANTLEHSVLALDSAKKIDEDGFAAYYEERTAALEQLEDATIMFDLRFFSEPLDRRLQIRLKDNGQGFKQCATNIADDKLHGRGLAIIRNLSDSLTYSDGGRTVEVVYRL